MALRFWYQNLDNKILKVIQKWAATHGHKDFHLNRPKLLSMMRFVDDDRSGKISFREFQRFGCECIEEHEREEQARKNSDASDASTEAIEFAFRKLAADDQAIKERLRTLFEKIGSDVPSQLDALEGSLASMLESVRGVKAAKGTFGDAPSPAADSETGNQDNRLKLDPVAAGAATSKSGTAKIVPLVHD